MLKQTVNLHELRSKPCGAWHCQFSVVYILTRNRRKMVTILKIWCFSTKKDTASRPTVGILIQMCQHAVLSKEQQCMFLSMLIQHRYLPFETWQSLQCLLPDVGWFQHHSNVFSSIHTKLPLKLSNPAQQPPNLSWLDNGDHWELGKVSIILFVCTLIRYSFDFLYSYST